MTLLSDHAAIWRAAFSGELRRLADLTGDSRFARAAAALGDSPPAPPRDESTEQRAERLADHLAASLVKKFIEHGLPLRPLADELLCLGTAILVEQLGPAGATRSLERAAAAAREQIRA